MAFDASKLPRAQLLRAYLGDDQKLHTSGWGKVRCRLPGCQHKNGDRSPSLKLNVESGAFECLTNGRQGKGWKDLVLTFESEERWRELCRAMGPSGDREDPQRFVKLLRERQHDLAPEQAWSQRYKLEPVMAVRHLRQGVRAPGDPHSDTVVLIREGEGGQLVGAKWRLPDGARWKVGKLAKQDPTAKYAWTPGSKASAILLAHEAHQAPDATLLVCAGEKDALVAASHLGREWAPVTGCFGEGKVPRELAELARGRRVVVAYDGDDAGRQGARKVVGVVHEAAAEVLVATLPEGQDLADVWEQGGVDRLLEILLEAAPLEGQQLQLALDSAPPPPPTCPPSAPPEADPPPGDDPKRKDPLDAWSESCGEVVRISWKGRKGQKVQEHHVQFRGIPRVARSVAIYTEDPDEPSGWAREERLTYRFRLQDGRKIERQTLASSRHFGDLIEGDSLLSGAFSALGSRGAREKLYLWTQRCSKASADRVEEFRALGPHEGLGWVAPGGVRVHQGKVEACPLTIGPPSTEEEFSRYRLGQLSDAEFKDTAHWIVEHMLRCDHVDGAYTLPLLGAFQSAALWPCLPALRSYQRFVFFGQGESGSGKTMTFRYFWSFWGDFVPNHGLTTWQTSATALENLLHHANAVPLFTADWKKSQFNREKLRESMQLIQSYADGSSRGRAKAGTQQVERRKPPRATWIVDGEDLPEGEQSTLGRMVVLCWDQHGQGLGASPLQQLAPAMVAKLPGVTARWIAYVSRHADQLSDRLEQLRVELERRVPQVASNHARLVRNYAVQQLGTEAFLEWLANEAGVPGVAKLCDRAWDLHLAMANTQLAGVSEQSAGELFFSTLRVLLHSGALTLRQKANSRTAGKRPFDSDLGGNTVQVGLYCWDEEKAWIWPQQALPVVQAHLTRGGGSRIEFGERAIRQQLAARGLIEPVSRGPRAGEHGRPRAWVVSLESLGARDLHAAASVGA